MEVRRMETEGQAKKLLREAKDLATKQFGEFKKLDAPERCVMIDGEGFLLEVRAEGGGYLLIGSGSDVFYGD